MAKFIIPLLLIVATISGAGYYHWRIEWYPVAVSEFALAALITISGGLIYWSERENR